MERDDIKSKETSQGERWPGPESLVQWERTEGPDPSAHSRARPWQLLCPVRPVQPCK